MGKFKRKGVGLLTLFCTIATLFSLTSCGGDVIGGDNNDFENTGEKTDSEDTGSGNKGDEGKDEHTHTYVEEVTNPTCTEKGFTTHTCSCVIAMLIIMLIHLDILIQKNGVMIQHIIGTLQYANIVKKKVIKQNILLMDQAVLSVVIL